VGFARFPAGPIPAIDEQEVLVFVIVEIQERASGAHGLGQVLLAKGTVVVLEGDPGSLGHVLQADSVGSERSADTDQAGQQNRSSYS
jgi:hypothetical protein